VIFDEVSGRVIVFGGKDDNDFNSDQTWALDPVSMKWEQLPTKGSKPPASEDHTAIYDPNSHRMILYGGENGPTTNKLWSLDLKTLTWRNQTRSDLPRRESHTAVYDSRGKRMVVFGGFDNNSVDLYDVWAMDLDPKSPTFEKWQNLTVEEGRPPGRQDHTAVYDPGKNRMVFNGGYTKARQGFFADTWAFYFADTPGGKGRWAKLDTKAEPPGRRHGVAVYHAERNGMLLFGGMIRRQYLNDVWVFDLGTDRWVEVKPTGSAPPPRIDHHALYNPRTRSLLVYGGDGRLDDRKLHDVWELSFAPSTSALLAAPWMRPGAAAASRQATRVAWAGVR
jgi:N-acetylneuraminic acid mutarotase